MESTSETAEIAADPTLLTIIVSAVPIMEFSNCSNTTGTNKAQIIRFENMCCCFILSFIPSISVLRILFLWILFYCIISVL